MQRNVTIDGQIIELTPFDNNVIDNVRSVSINGTKNRRLLKINVGRQND